MTTGDATLAGAGIDAAALKPSETDLRRSSRLDVATLVVDYEGREHVPDAGVLEDLAGTFDLRVTVPVRADGFDPLDEDGDRARLPAAAGEVFVAGNAAYLREEEAGRAVAPRLRAAVASAADPWVGTEGIERLAMAAGGTQFELLSDRTAREVRALRAVGFEGGIAVYAPTVFAADDDAILEALGAYVARRGRVRRALPDGTPVDGDTTGQARETLLGACREYALAGDPEAVAGQVAKLREAGVDRIVAYPARGLDAVLG